MNRDDIIGFRLSGIAIYVLLALAATGIISSPRAAIVVAMVAVAGLTMLAWDGPKDAT